MKEYEIAIDIDSDGPLILESCEGREDEDEDENGGISSYFTIIENS